jgi:hypothetical protein
MKQGPQRQGPAQRFAHGTRVTATVEGVIMNNGGGRGSLDVFHGAQRVRDGAGLDHWLYPWSDAVPIIVISPPPPLVAAGQLWMTGDGAYMARISRKDLPLRMTPSDQSPEAGLTTVDVDRFFRIYPDATLEYDPNTPDRLIAEPLFDRPAPAQDDAASGEHIPLLLGGDAKHKPHAGRLCQNNSKHR